VVELDFMQDFLLEFLRGQSGALEVELMLGNLGAARLVVGEVQLIGGKREKEKNSKAKRASDDRVEEEEEEEEELMNDK
jgi:hypothetical protein